MRLRGDFRMPPAFSVPPPFTLRVRDSAGLDRTHTFTSCTNLSNGRVRCSDTASDGVFKAYLKPPRSNPSTMTFRVSFLRQAVSAPFVAPVTVTLTHNGGVTRVGTISNCRATSATMSCKGP